MKELLGQTRYIPFLAGFVIPVTITEVSRTWFVRGTEIPSAWEFAYIDGDHIDVTEYLKANPTAEPSETVFIDIDEPIGHSEFDDGTYCKTLEEAFSDLKRTNISRNRAKHIFRAWRIANMHFIRESWRRNSEKHPGFPKYSVKKPILWIDFRNGVVV